VSVEEPPSFKTVVDTYVAAIESLASGRYGLPWPGCADQAFSFGGENYAIVALRVSQEFYATRTTPTGWSRTLMS
jgi:hypothetical protein